MPSLSVKQVFMAKLLDGVYRVSLGKAGTTLTVVTLAGAATAPILSAVAAEMGNSLLFVPHSDSGRAYVPPMKNPFFLLYPPICNF